MHSIGISYNWISFIFQIIYLGRVIEISYISISCLDKIILSNIQY